jgi:hypothetical protein
VALNVAQRVVDLAGKRPIVWPSQQLYGLPLKRQRIGQRFVALQRGLQVQGNDLQLAQARFARDIASLAGPQGVGRQHPQQAKGTHSQHPAKRAHHAHPLWRAR